MRKVIFGNTYKGYPLSKTRKKFKGFYVEILDPIIAILESYTERHGRVLFVPLVLKYPAGSSHKYPDDNVLLSQFINSFLRHYRRNGADPEYLWAREYSGEDLLHYHTILLLDLNYTRDPEGVKLVATELWRRRLGIPKGEGYVHLDPSNFEYKLIRSDYHFQQDLNSCFEQVSYLAKVYDKGEAPPNVNEFGCSRIPRTFNTRVRKDKCW
jgi:hypothetical protein